MTLPAKIVTIGAYGFSEESFFKTLQDAGVDTFCDIRRRRGVRGSRYAFANSKRLQSRLAELGIKYHHLLELAPTAEIRERQKAADKAAVVSKRQRKQLAETFIAFYEEEILGQFDVDSFLSQVGTEAKVIALFCVEKEPEACHRSLVAQKLEQKLGLTIEHQVP